MFELCESKSENHATHLKDEVFKIYEIDKFPDDIESVYPVLYYKDHQKIYIIRSRHGEPPQILFYAYQNLQNQPIGRVIEHRRVLKLPLVKVEQVLY